MPSLARLSKRFRAADINRRLDLSLTLQVSEDPLKRPYTRYDRGPEIHGKPRRVSHPVGEAQLAGCLRVQVDGPLEWAQASSNYAQGVVQDTVDEASVSTATPNWRTVLSC